MECPSIWRTVAWLSAIFDDSDLIIAHAGMGIILKSLVSGKPIIIMPRMLNLKEHMTDHQIATARILEKYDYVNVAWTNEGLTNYLMSPDLIESKKRIGEFASSTLINTVKDFINQI